MCQISLRSLNFFLKYNCFFKEHKMAARRETSHFWTCVYRNFLLFLGLESPRLIVSFPAGRLYIYSNYNENIMYIIIAVYGLRVRNTHRSEFAQLLSWLVTTCCSNPVTLYVYKQKFYKLIELTEHTTIGDGTEVNFRRHRG